MVRKLITYLQIVFIISNSIGGIFAFYGIKSHFKSEFKKYKFSNSNALLKEVLTFRKNELQYKVRFENDNEFHYLNQLYDVISHKETKDSIEFTVLNDSKEKILYGSFFSYLEKNVSDKTDNIKKIINNIFIGLIYFVSHHVVTFLDCNLNKQTFSKLTSHYNSIYIEFPSPPPKY